MDAGGGNSFTSDSTVQSLQDLWECEDGELVDDEIESPKIPEPKHLKKNPEDITPLEKKSLLQFRCKVQDAILGRYLLDEEDSNISSTSSQSKSNDITLWGIPLLPSKKHPGLDAILLKFLIANNCKVKEAFEMLRKVMKWRSEFNVEGILDEKFDPELAPVAFIDSSDRDGRPLFFMAYGAFKDVKLYEIGFGTEENRQKFVRWRVHMIEKGIQRLNFKANEGMDSLLQITDCKDTTGPITKEFLVTSKNALVILQENYPEIIYKNILINVPTWYYVYHKLFNVLLSGRAMSKFVLARPSQVTKTLLRFVAPENLWVQYGGFKRENDDEFTPDDKVLELSVDRGSTESIHISVVETGQTIIWDVMVVGWDVTYTEEFVPLDGCSKKDVLVKNQKMVETSRNSYNINEPGVILVNIYNDTYRKKTILYRYKLKQTKPTVNTNM